MKYLLIENLAILLCATIGILSGIHYLNTRKAMYAGMIVLGMMGKNCLIIDTGSK